MTKDTLTKITCSACGELSPFSADTTACPHCGSDLQQHALETCKNCELQYNPYGTDHCPSCNLGIDEIVCAKCGLFYAPFNDGGEQVPCPGCKAVPAFGTGKRYDHERPVEDGQDPEDEDNTPEEEPTIIHMLGEETEDEPEQVDVPVETWIETEIVTRIETILESCMDTAIVSWVETRLETCMDTSIITWVETRLETCMHGEYVTHLETWFETCTCESSWVDESWMDTPCEGYHSGSSIVTEYIPCPEIHYSTHLVSEIAYCTELHYSTHLVTEYEPCTALHYSTWIVTEIDSWIESDVAEYPDDNDGPDKTEVPEDTDLPEDEEEQDTDCPCDKDDADNEPAGTSSGENGCVDFGISFGRTPAIPGLGVGRLSLYSGMLDGRLANAGALTYNHVMLRRLYSIEEESGTTALTKTMVGVIGGTSRAPSHTMFNLRAGAAAITSASMSGSRTSKDLMSPVVDPATNTVTAYEETLRDGTVLHYNRATGFVDWMKRPDGGMVTCNEFEKELKVIRAHRKDPSSVIDRRTVASKLVAAPRKDYGYIRQVWNRSDGLLDIVIRRPDGRGRSGYDILWYAPEDIAGFDGELGVYLVSDGAVPVKTWEVYTELCHYYESGNTSLPSPGRGEKVTYPSGGSYPQNREERLSGSLGEGVELKTALSVLEIVERRGDLSFPIRWEQPNLTTLVFKRGTGSEAEVCVKKRQGARNGVMVVNGVSSASPMCSLTYPGGGSIGGTTVFNRVPGGRCTKTDGYGLRVNGEPCDEVVDIKYYYKGEGPYVPDNAQAATRTIRKRYAFGDAVICEETGYGTPLCKRTVYIHDTNKNSRTYGRRLMTVKPDGTRISYNYDRQGRLIKKVKAWVGGGVEITRCTWCNKRTNDRRPASVTTWVRKDGQYAMVRRTCTTYEENDAFRRETQTVTGRGLAAPVVTVREWYGSDPAANGQACAWAASRPKRTVEPDGIETNWTYHDTDEFGAVFKAVSVKGRNGAPVAHRSTMTVNYVNDKGQTVATCEYVHMGERRELDGAIWYEDTAFKLVNRETTAYDHAGKPASVTRLDGRVQTTEWICKGPLNTTDENGITTTYQYNSAKQLASSERQAVQWGERHA